MEKLYRRECRGWVSAHCSLGELSANRSARNTLWASSASKLRLVPLNFYLSFTINLYKGVVRDREVRTHRRAT